MKVLIGGIILGFVLGIVFIYVADTLWGGPR